MKNLTGLTTSRMHRASLRKSVVLPAPPQAIFCQYGKIGQVKNKALLFEERQWTLSTALHYCGFGKTLISLDLPGIVP
jgi:hypothetical protein